MSPYLKLWVNRLARFALGSAAVYAATYSWVPSWSMPWFALLFSLPFAFVGWKTATALLLVAIGGHAIKLAEVPFSTEAAPFASYLAALPVALLVSWFSPPRELVFGSHGDGHYQLSIETIGGSAKLHISTAKDWLSLGNAAPSLVPIGSLRLESSIITREETTEVAGYITPTGTYFPPYTQTKTVDTGLRSLSILNDQRVPFPPTQRLDHSAVAELSAAEERSRFSGIVLNVTVTKSDLALINRWWRASRRQLEGLNYEAARAKLERTVHANVQSIRKRAQINGEGEHRLDARGNVTFYVEMNRKGELYYLSGGTELRLSGRASVEFVRSLADPSLRSSQASHSAGLNVLSFDSPVVRMAQYVDQAISR